MKALVSNAHGFQFEWSSLAVKALLFSLSGQTDLRRIERFAELQPEILLREIHRQLANRFHAGNRQDFAVAVNVTDALKARLETKLAEQKVLVCLEMQQPALEEALRAGLRAPDVEFTTGGRTPSETTLKKTHLLVRDLTETRLEWARTNPPASILQVRLHSDQASLRVFKPQHGLDFPAMVFTSVDPPEIGAAALTTLKDALDLARFSCAWERLKRAHIRWRLARSFTFDPQANRVDVRLDLEGEERVLASKDLRMGSFWSEVPEVRLADVAGHAAAKEAAKEVLSWLADPAAQGGLRGYIVEGPPGTGKSLFCASLAGEAAVPHIHMAASEWLCTYWGQTEKAIRQTFQALSQYDACVLTVEEFDGIAYDRQRASSSSPAYYASMIGALLACLDEARRGKTRVVFLATTNLYGDLDAAVVRSLRLGERLHLGLPGTQDRRELLAKRLAGTVEGMELEEAANMTAGLSQADLTALCQRFLKDRPKDFSAFHDHLLAFRRGPCPEGMILSAATKARIAVHEAGHALVAYHLLGTEAVESVSILPALDGSLGAFLTRPTQEVTHLGPLGVRNRLAVMLAGRSAELLQYPDQGQSEGSGADLGAATTMALSAIGDLGLDDDFPCLTFSALPPALQECLAKALMERVEAWIDEALQRGRTILVAHQVVFERLGEVLLQEEVLHRARIQSILGGGG